MYVRMCDGGTKIGQGKTWCTIIIVCEHRGLIQRATHGLGGYVCGTQHSTVYVLYQRINITWYGAPLDDPPATICMAKFVAHFAPDACKLFAQPPFRRVGFQSAILQLSAQ